MVQVDVDVIASRLTRIRKSDSKSAISQRESRLCDIHGMYARDGGIRLDCTPLSACEAIERIMFSDLSTVVPIAKRREACI